MFCVEREALEHMSTYICVDQEGLKHMSFETFVFECEAMEHMKR